MKSYLYMLVLQIALVVDDILVYIYIEVYIYIL